MDKPKGDEKSTKATIIGVLIIAAWIAVSVLGVSAPVERLLGEGAHAVRAAFHGLFASLFLVTATIGLFQAGRLWIGSDVSLQELDFGSLLNAVACVLAVVTGNWIYLSYSLPEGPRAHLLAVAPEVHSVFFEFKESAALFTVPLTIAASFIVSTYGKRLLGRRVLRETVALLLVLAFFYLVIAFGLGAAVNRLRPV